MFGPRVYIVDGGQAIGSVSKNWKMLILSPRGVVHKYAYRVLAKPLAMVVENPNCWSVGGL